MFLLGYIAAPPTITVFSWASVVSAAIMPSANAVTAAVVSAAFRAKFMKPSRSACRSHERSRSTNTGGPCAGMPGVGSQACELAAGDDRTGRQPAGRAARMDGQRLLSGSSVSRPRTGHHADVSNRAPETALQPETFSNERPYLIFNQQRHHPRG